MIKISSRKLSLTFGKLTAAVRTVGIASNRNPKENVK